jgi:hypothetical protein
MSAARTGEGTLTVVSTSVDAVPRRCRAGNRTSDCFALLFKRSAITVRDPNHLSALGRRALDWDGQPARLTAGGSAGQIAERRRAYVGAGVAPRGTDSIA